MQKMQIPRNMVYWVNQLGQEASEASPKFSLRFRFR